MEMTKSLLVNNGTKHFSSNYRIKFAILLTCLFSLATGGFSQSITTIDSFSPTSGPVGTTVTINGAYFSYTPTNNIVFFGAVRATVLTATSNVLTVSVPAGATNKPITVTTNGLTAYSRKPFFTTFTGAGSTLAAYSFDTTINTVTDMNPNGIAICDFDGDGKPDIATPNNYSAATGPASFSVLRNTSSTGNLSFAPKVDFANGVNTYAIAAADIDGDGKQDIVVSSAAENTISVFRNTSTPGNISFAPKVDYATASGSYGIAIRDLDWDGKPDIVVSNYLAGSLYIYRNTGSIGTIAFSAPLSLTTNLGPRGIAIADIDGDNSPEIAVANELSNTVTVFHNLSTIGSLSFGLPKNYETASGPYSVAIGDLDNDGKQDMAAVGGYTLGVFRNISSFAFVSFGTRTDIGTGADASYVIINDLNGDTKPDILVTSANVSVHQNTTSTPGSITFAARQFLSLGPGNGIKSFVTEVGDFDGDARPDLASAMFTISKVLVHRNKLNEPHISTYNPSAAATGATVNISGYNFTGATAVSFGGQPAASFSVINANSIAAVVGTGYSGKIAITTPYGTGTNYGNFTFAGPPIITSMSPTSAGVGQEVLINGNNFNDATAVSFGGTPASFTVLSPNLIRAVVGNGSSGNVAVTTPYGTVNLAGFTYLPIPIINSFTPIQAAQGTTITITGNNFTGTTAVSFGGVPAASFTVVSATSITAVLGNGASGNITVTNAFGTSSKPGFTFIPAPTITSFSPTEGIAGTVITVTGTNFANITNLRVGGVSYLSSYTLVSPTTITIPLTSSGASGDILITTTGGTATMPGFVFYKVPRCDAISPAVANTGMEVTITGAEFYAVSQVTLGGVPVASYTVISPTTIKAIVGTGNSGPVRVTNPAGSNTTYPTFAFSSAPIITAYSPNSGPIGTLVTIKGGGFNSNPVDNLVRFGTIKATVVNATANTLTVQVPYGTPYKEVSVTNTGNSAAAFSDIPFNVTFPADTANFNDNSFGGKFTIPTATNLGGNTTGDIDGDGKPDILVHYKNGTFISIYRNTSTSTQLSFAPRVDIPVDSRISNIVLGDLNNDGKTDIICNNSSFDGTNAIMIGIKNNSTVGNISFDNFFSISNYECDVITTGDFNADGKLDIAVTSLPRTSGGTGSPNTRIRIDIYPNTSTGGNISFGSYLSFYSNNISTSESVFHTDLTTKDIDNDKKPDIVLGTTGNFFVVFRNTGTANYQFTPSNVGNFSYADYGKNKAAIADFDQDGYPDIVTEHHIHKNLGNFTFSTTLKANIGVARAVADLNGDGRPDFIRTRSYIDSFVYIIKNNSTAAGISFAPAYTRKVQWLNWGPSATDLDEDGRPDIIYVSHGADSIVILKNQTGAGVLCPGGSTNFRSSIDVGSNFQWQVNMGSGFVDIANNANYSGATTATLQLSNIPTAWYGYQYRCTVDGVNSAVYTVQFFNSWTGTVSTDWENPANWSCGVLPDDATDVVITSGTITLGTNTTIRSLKLHPSVNFTVAQAAVLTILH